MLTENSSQVKANSCSHSIVGPKWITSGRSAVEGKSPSDLAERTELRIFSPTLDKSIPPPWNNKKGTKTKKLGLWKPPSSVKSPFNKKGFPKTVPNGNWFGCISAQITITQCGTVRHSNNSIIAKIWVVSEILIGDLDLSNRLLGEERMKWMQWWR